MAGKTVQVKLDPETYKAVAKTAIDYEMSVSGFINAFLSENFGPGEEEEEAQAKSQSSGGRKKKAKSRRRKAEESEEE